MMSDRDYLGIAILACYLLESSDEDDSNDDEADSGSKSDGNKDPIPNTDKTLLQRKRKLSPDYSSSTDDNEVTCDTVPNKTCSKLNAPMRHKPRRVWCLNPNERDDEICANLLLELSSDAPELKQNFAYMSGAQFNQLLQLVTPRIQKSNTTMRMCISASDRLVLTLRFLAAGESFRKLHDIFRIPQKTISIIVPRVLEAIYAVLANDYLKVLSYKLKY